MGARFSDVYILFPDPWPKRRHRKNRLLQPAFLKQIAGRAGRGAALRIRTDHKGYFEEIAAMIGADPAWRISDKNEWPLEIPTVFQQKSTHYFSITALRT
jgi:tRNA (guanine-N7-)-methyltransferase